MMMYSLEKSPRDRSMMLNTGNCGLRLRSWLSLKAISKAFLRPSVQKYSISKVSAKKSPNRYKA